MIFLACGAQETPSAPDLQEFRGLTSKHANKADKLQIKNVIFHAMNGCIDYLSKHAEAPKDPPLP